MKLSALILILYPFLLLLDISKSTLLTGLTFAAALFKHLTLVLSLSLLLRISLFDMFECFASFYPADALKNLKYLDLTGCYVADVYSACEEWSLPESLETLILRDCAISMYNTTLLMAISDHHQLKWLDISLTQLAIEDLKMLSQGLEDLEVFNMAGECLGLFSCFRVTYPCVVCLFVDVRINV